MTSVTDRTVYPITWVYGESDPALMLWTACLDKWQMALPLDAKVLELGCAETDFLERLHRLNPRYEVTGVDCYPQPRSNVIAGDACNPDLFQPETFDAVILLGALEHFGLGFYGDPIHQSGEDCVGDILAMVNVAHWLKPGGWVYFDVPCNPRGRIQENRHFRQYAPSEVKPRLLHPGGLREVERVYSWPEPNAGTFCEEPTGELVPYWFVSVLAEKRC
jgi:SAM-dependent methyltransferase